jgi:hypothetical protein
MNANSFATLLVGALKEGRSTPSGSVVAASKSGGFACRGHPRLFKIGPLQGPAEDGAPFKNSARSFARMELRRSSTVISQGLSRQAKPLVHRTRSADPEGVERPSRMHGT